MTNKKLLSNRRNIKKAQEYWKKIGIAGKNNPAYKYGNRLTGNFPCPICGKDRTTERRYADLKCRECSYRLRRESPKTDFVKKYRERKITFKEQIIEEHGGKCKLCGIEYPYYVYEFHHKDPKEKKFNPSYVFRQSDINKIREETDKCILLCSNCHKHIHWGPTTT